MEAFAQDEFSEKYIEHVAKTYKISKVQAVKNISECLKLTSAKLNVDYKTVYNTFFDEERIGSCLVKEGVCDKLEIDECREACGCFYLEPWGCLPKQIPDAEEINKDPDAYIKEKLGKTVDLQRMVQIASYLYYNYTGGGLTDNSYDSLEYHLKKREKIKGRLYEKIGAPPVEKIRVELPYPMPSLRKLKPGTHELDGFLGKFDEKEGSVPSSSRLVWMEKLDGVSGMVVYEGGKISGIYTRGDGLVGGDVTYLGDWLKSIPAEVSCKSKVVVRGEFILARGIFQTKYSGDYSNPRSFVSGKINSGFISPALPDIEFVAYSLLYLDRKKCEEFNFDGVPTQSLKILDVFGFKVVTYGIIERPVVFDLMQTYKAQRESSRFNIDGLVIVADEPRPEVDLSTEGEISNPIGVFAFKMLLEEQIRDSKITTVEWNISRYGRYVPVAVYEAVYVDGVRLHRATAHNAQHIQDWSMGAGTKIKIARSGDVIPQINDVTVDESIEPIFPPTSKEGGWEWYWKRRDIVLEDVENNPRVQIKRILHFFKVMGVKGIGEKKAENFWEGGLKTAEAIVSASVGELIKIKRMGKKSSEKLHLDIRSQIRDVPPDRIIVASSTFKSGLGRTLLRQLFMNIPDILYLTEYEIRARFAAKKIRGFGKSRIESSVRGIEEFKKYIGVFDKGGAVVNMGYYIDWKKAVEAGKINKRIMEKKFVLTGFMSNKDYDFEDNIYFHGGEIVSTVTSGIEAVISASITNITKKMTDAHALKVPVLTKDEFKRRYVL